ncbi:MAG: hypothetical protein WKF59_23740 [Chitinophagaceae bacterium]
MAFTIWIYDESEKQNDIKLYDLTEWKKANLNNILWENKDKEKEIDKDLSKALKKSSEIKMSKKRNAIKNSLNQKMYDFKRDPTKFEIKSTGVYGGLPIKGFTKRK